MQQCEKLATCPFFNNKMAAMPSIADMIKHKFCLGSREECARYQVAVSGRPVPADLFPTHHHRVAALLGG